MRIEIPHRLEGTEVVLRPLRADDAAPHAEAFREDSALGRLLGFEEDPDEQWALERIEFVCRMAEEGKATELAIADPAGDAFWGAVTLHHFEWQHRRCEVGFWLVRGVRGRGIGSAAVSLAVSWVLGELGLLRVEMTTTPENDAAQALARRLGFKQEGVLRARNIERGRRVDLVWFGLLREEWPRIPAP